MNGGRVHVPGISGEAAGGPVLFVFAHQDDEIAYLGLMRRLAGRGRDIRVVWTTDGAYRVPAEIRRRESGANMSRLGIGRDRLEFWEYPDGRSIEHAGRILERLATLVRELRPAEVYTVAYEGGHPDHDLAHFAAVTAARRLVPAPTVYEAPLYNKCGARHVAFNRFVPAENETLHARLGLRDLAFKLRCILTYRSQFWVTVVPLLLFAGRRLLGAGEPYREVPAWNYLQPPHEGKLGYEGYLMRRMLGIRFSGFRSAVISTDQGPGSL